MIIGYIIGIVIFAAGFAAGLFSEREHQRRIYRKRGFRLSESEMPYEDGTPVPPEKRAHVHIAEIRTKRNTTAR